MFKFNSLLSLLRFAIVLVLCLSALPNAYGIQPAIDLTAEEKSFLESHGPVVFTSQSNYPPFEFRQKDGFQDGMTIELAHWLATEIGFRARFIDSSFLDAQQAVLAGEADVLTSLFESQQRRNHFDFTQTLFEVPASIFVLAERPDIVHLEDLSGKTIAIQRGDYAEEYLKNSGISFELLSTSDFAEATQAVFDGKADAIIGDEQIVLYYLFSHGLSERLKKVGEPLYIGDSCMAVEKNNLLLRSILDKGLSFARSNGVFERLERKWVGTQYINEKDYWKLIWPYLTALVLLLAAAGYWNYRLRQLVERKTRALRQSTEQLNLVLDSAELGTWDWAVPTGQVSTNERWNEMLGFSAAETERELSSWEELIHPEDKLVVQTALDAHLAGRTPIYQVEYRLGTKSGQWKWVLDVGKVIARNKQGEAQRVVGIHQDITSRKQAEQALKDSEHRYRTLLNKQSDAVFLYRFQGDGFSSFLEVNSQATKLYGYSHEDFLALGPDDLALPEEIKRYRNAHVSERLLKRGMLAFEGIHINKAGSCFPVEVNESVVDLQGEKCILATVRDISDRKNAELERQLNSDRLITIFNSIDAGVYVTDIETGEILFMNQYLINEFGQDMTGQKCWESFYQQKSHCLQCPHDLKLDETGHPTRIHTWQDVNPLTGKSYVNRNSAMQWTDGRTVRLQISTDITDIKAMEAQLRQKYKMEAVGVMAGGIAHDFNNILAIIMTNLELLQRKMNKDSPLMPRIEQAKAAAIRANELIKQILTYGRQGEQVMKPVQLSVIVDEALKLLRSTIPASVEILTQIDSDTHSVKINAESIQIEEVLINLCQNAVHAMKEKGLLTVALSRVDFKPEQVVPLNTERLAGPYLKLMVRDTGSGMKSQIQDKIFDPFYTTKPVGQGTGMGLSISHGIIAKHNGVISVDSQPGHGSTFSVYLPVIDAIETTAPELTTEQLAMGNEQILLIDDEEFLARSTAEFLQQLGYRVTIETQSKKALETFKRQVDQFDLVLTDQTMPGLTGLDLAAELLKVKADLPIILCTGYSSIATAEKAIAMGIRNFFMKPLVFADLAAAIRECLDSDR